jgi:hypothetical protein
MSGEFSANLNRLLKDSLILEIPYFLGICGVPLRGGAMRAAFFNLAFTMSVDSRGSMPAPSRSVLALV